MHPLAYHRRGGDDFLARLAQVESLSTEAQPRGSAQSNAGDMKSEKVAAPLDNIKSAMDGAGGFIANFFLGMGGASGAKAKELAKKTAPYEGPEVDYARVHCHMVHALAHRHRNPHIDQRRQVPYGAIEAKAAVVVQVHERVSKHYYLVGERAVTYARHTHVRSGVHSAFYASFTTLTCEPTRVQAHMRGRAVRNPVTKAAPAGILAPLYNCLPDGFFGATGGGDQARVEMRTEV